MTKAYLLTTYISLILSLPLLGQHHPSHSEDTQKMQDQEVHLGLYRQLTDGGDNAEAYFDKNSQRLIFQSNDNNLSKKTNGCDQIYTYDLEDSEGNIQMISTGLGRTTCSYFVDDNTVVYASTEEKLKECKEARSLPNKYLWELYPEYEIYLQDLASGKKEKLTNNDYYDAEATVSPDGKSIVYTSTESGDLELWIMNLETREKYQVTDELGYDGGAFFSHDGKKLVYRASRPKSVEEIQEYKDFLSQGLVAPTNMEIYTCNIDGSEVHQVTNLGKANWAPFFHPDDKRIIFSSNHHSERGYNFQLFMINEEGTELEQITYSSLFNAFPMFSRDGKYLIFSSNRNNKPGTRDTNLFLCTWKD